ncbi:MAG: methylmalonyl-CoA epimerase [Candidatus Bathyarchaeota archaeon]|nr:MAG: methylmalonyl-CoA epimerase [Candidatus Bathyarchaeota archaeon]
MITGIEHIGIAVNKIADIIDFYEDFLGLKLVKIEESKQHRIKAALLTVNNMKIELIEPLDKESSISKFLDRKGQGIHHIAFRVDDLGTLIKDLKSKGFILIDEKPRIGIEGKKIAFLHPKSTGNVLIELCEH